VLFVFVFFVCRVKLKLGKRNTVKGSRGIVKCRAGRWRSLIWISFGRLSLGFVG
jgi:hypothetical protein